MTSSTSPNFSQFRSGTPVVLPSGERVWYRELQGCGLQEFYIRIIHELARRAEVTKQQVNDWRTRAGSQDRRVAQAVRAELEARRPLPAAPVQEAARQVGVKKARQGRTKAEKVFSLVSRGDHKQAVKLAQGYALSPTPVPETALRPGQSAEAHTVRAPESVASKLITSGQWKTEG
jgi:hypothetical protein